MYKSITLAILSLNIISILFSQVNILIPIYYYYLSGHLVIMYIAVVWT